jgi:hypothetical protein
MDARSSRKRKDVISWILWGLVIALYLAWPLTHLEAYRWTNDEGLHMQEAALVNAGYPLYTETAFNKPPLLIWILRAAFKIGGTTMATARLTVLSLTLMGFVATGITARQLWGKWAGLTAMAIILALPELPVRAHVVMAGLPPMCFGLVSMAGAILFQYRRRSGWIVLSGAALAGAILIHPLHIYWTLPLAVILFLPDWVLPAKRPLHRAGWWDVLLFLAPMIIAGASTLALVDRRSFFAWVFQSNYQAVKQVPLGENWEMLSGFLRSSWALIGLSVASSAMLGTSPTERRALPLLVAWWLATFAMLLILTPLWRQYLIFLSFPLAIASAGGIVAAGNWMLGLGDRGWSQGGLNTVWAVLTIVGLIAFGVDRWEKTRPHLLQGPEWSSEHLAARAFIEAAVPPDGFVATDDALLAFAAGRLVQPPFTEASVKQIELGNFTTEDAVEGMLRYGAQAALFGTGRLKRLPGFEEWIDEVATERREFGEMRAYRLDLPRRDPISAMARFENGIELRGYALSMGKLAPGDTFAIMLFWRYSATVPEDYHVFVHLVDEEGVLRGQHDGPLQGGEGLTGQWRKEEMVFDTHQVSLGPHAPSGTYRLSAGMYPWPSLDRVPAYRPDGERWPEDRVVLTEVDVAVGR